MRLVVLHGFTGTPGSHWLPWLGRELGGLADVVVPALPDTEAPRRDAWVATVRAALGPDAGADPGAPPASGAVVAPLGPLDPGAQDGSVVVVAHSLGTVAALLALRERPRASLAGVVLVSPFWSALPSSPELDAFVEGLPALTGAVAADVPVVVVVSDHDEVVEVERSLAVAHALDATVVRVPGGGHFLEREGWTTLPEVRDVVLGMLGEAGEPPRPD